MTWVGNKKLGLFLFKAAGSKKIYKYCINLVQSLRKLRFKLLPCKNTNIEFAPTFTNCCFYATSLGKTVVDYFSLILFYIFDIIFTSETVLYPNTIL